MARLTYNQFRTGLTFAEVAEILRVEAMHVFEREGRRMFITRRTVLGRWHEIKLRMWAAHKNRIEVDLDYSGPNHFESDGYEYDEPSTQSEWDRADAWQRGSENPSTQRVLTDRDVRHKNLFYVEPDQPHPEMDYDWGETWFEIAEAESWYPTTVPEVDDLPEDGDLPF